MPFWIFEKTTTMKRILLLLAVILVSAGISRGQNVPPPPPDSDTTRIEDMVFTKVDVEASFPGGDAGWRQYLMKNLHPERIVDMIKFPKGKKEFTQTVIVKFIVSRDGSLHDITAENKEADPYCIAEAVRVIKVSPKWIPASQNGRKVNAYRRQPITFVFER